MQAAQKIASDQAINREKSQQKIKELTKQHAEQKAKNGQPAKLTKEQKKQRKIETLDSEGDEDMESESKSKSKEKQFKNKNALSSIKQENKRAQKEATKKIKEKRSKGTHIGGGQGDHNRNGKADSSSEEEPMLD